MIIIALVTLYLNKLRRGLSLFPVNVGEKPNALAEPRGEEENLTKKGKKKKTVHWAEEEQLKHYFYFDLDETERGKKLVILSCLSRKQINSQMFKTFIFISQSTSTRLKILARQPNESS